MKLIFIFWAVTLPGLVACCSFDDKLNSSHIKKQKTEEFTRYFNDMLSCSKKYINGTISCTKKEKPFLVRSKEEKFVCFAFLKRQYQQQKKQTTEPSTVKK